MRLAKGRGVVVAVLALFVALAVISPALGGPSLKKLIKKEVAKQLAKKHGPTGPPGASFDANATLSPSETLTGIWAAAAGTGGIAVGVISFAPQLPSVLSDTAVHRLTPGATTAACPGQGQAAPGQLCVYERASANVNFNVIANPATGDNGSGRRGAVIQYSGTNTNAYVDGTWAVTAP
jgi:hypothetical protein